MPKITDFTLQQLQSERFQNKNLRNNGSYICFIGGATCYQTFDKDNGVVTRFPFEPKDLADDTWDIYMPSIKLKTGNYYRDRQNNILYCAYHCQKQDIFVCFTSEDQLKYYTPDGRLDTSKPCYEFDLIAHMQPAKPRGT